MLPNFDERKGGDGLRGEQNRDTLLKNAEKFYIRMVYFSMMNNKLY